MIDPDGFRPNVGIILCNASQQLFWARRIGQDAWQFPQGGIHSDETPEEAMYRELTEEVGLAREDVEMVGSTRGWLRYRLPKRYIRKNCQPTCIGQKQVWYLLKLLSSEKKVQLDQSDKPEFDYWRWVNFWQPPREVIFFKREVYLQALHELAPLIFPDTRKRRAGRHPYCRQSTRR